MRAAAWSLVAVATAAAVLLIWQPAWLGAWLDRYQAGAMARRQNERLRQEELALRADARTRQARLAAQGSARAAQPRRPVLNERSSPSQIRSRLAQTPPPGFGELEAALDVAASAGDLALVQAILATAPAMKSAAQKAAVKADQTAMATALLRGAEPAATADGPLFWLARSDAMLEALVGDRYAALRYADQPLANDARRCYPDFSHDPTVVAAVVGSQPVSGTWAPGKQPPSDRVQLRVLRVLNPDLLDENRLARALGAVPGNRADVPRVGARWAKLRAGDRVEVAWPPLRGNRRLRPPPRGTRLILSFGESFGQVLADPCLVAGTPMNEAATRKSVAFWLRYERSILPTPRIPGQPMLLQGPPSALALNAGPELDPRPASADEIQGNVILDELDVAFDPKATVGQVNAAIRLVNGSIESRERATWSFTLHVPKARDAGELEEVARRFGAMPGILEASTSQMPSPKGLPRPREVPKESAGPEPPSPW
ncbi:MAG TPA: hypothetical protein VMB50_12285 [Myxococcales bacterium]|nr:hypothetical protein [Myxococcales bacterium]